MKLTKIRFLYLLSRPPLTRVQSSWNSNGSFQHTITAPNARSFKKDPYTAQKELQRTSFLIFRAPHKNRNQTFGPKLADVTFGTTRNG